MTITDSMLRLAQKLGSPIIFITCHLEGGRVVVRLEEVAGENLPTLTSGLVRRIEDDRRRVANAPPSVADRSPGPPPA